KIIQEEKNEIIDFLKLHVNKLKLDRKLDLTLNNNQQLIFFQKVKKVEKIDMKLGEILNSISREFQDEQYSNDQEALFQSWGSENQPDYATKVVLGKIPAQRVVNKIIANVENRRLFDKLCYELKYENIESFFEANDNAKQNIIEIKDLLEEHLSEVEYEYLDKYWLDGLVELFNNIIRKFNDPL
ncbi:MAG: hypothetical protein AAF599_03595, partial [Bacteroidota bacterium]